MANNRKLTSFSQSSSWINRSSKSTRDLITHFNNGIDALSLYTDEAVGIDQRYSNLLQEIQRLKNLSEQQQSLEATRLLTQATYQKTLLDESRKFRLKSKQSYFDDHYWEYLELCIIYNQLQQMQDDLLRRLKEINEKIDREKQSNSLFDTLKNAMTSFISNQSDYERIDPEFANNLRRFSNSYSTFLSKLMPLIGKIETGFLKRDLNESTTIADSLIDELNEFRKTHEETLNQLKKDFAANEKINQLNQLRQEWNDHGEFSLFTCKQLDEYLEVVKHLETSLLEIANKIKTNSKTKKLVAAFIEKLKHGIDNEDEIQSFISELDENEKIAWNDVIERYQQLYSVKNQIITEMYKRLELAKDEKTYHYSDTIIKMHRAIKILGGMPFSDIEEIDITTPISTSDKNEKKAKLRIIPRADLTPDLILKFKDHIEASSLKKYLPEMSFFKKPKQWVKYKPKNELEKILFNHPALWLTINTFDNRFRVAKAFLGNVVDEILIDHLDTNGNPTWIYPLGQQLEEVRQVLGQGSNKPTFLSYISKTISAFEVEYKEEIRNIATAAENAANKMVKEKIQALKGKSTPIDAKEYEIFLKRLNRAAKLVNQQSNKNFNPEEEIKAAYCHSLMEKLGEQHSITPVDIENAAIIIGGTDADDQTKQLIRNQFTPDRLKEYARPNIEDTIDHFVKDLLFLVKVKKEPSTAKIEFTKSGSIRIIETKARPDLKKLESIASTYVRLTHKLSDSKPADWIELSDYKSNKDKLELKIPRKLSSHFPTNLKKTTWRAQFFNEKKLELIKRINAFGMFTDTIALNANGTYFALENLSLNTAIQIITELDYCIDNEIRNIHIRWSGPFSFFAKWTHNKSFEMEKAWEKQLLTLKQTVDLRKNQIIENALGVDTAWKFITTQSAFGYTMVNHQRARTVRNNILALSTSAEQNTEKQELSATALINLDKKYLTDYLTPLFNKHLLNDNFKQKGEGERNYLLAEFTEALNYSNEIYNRNNVYGQLLADTISEKLASILTQTSSFDPASLQQEKVLAKLIISAVTQPAYLATLRNHENIVAIRNQIRDFISHQRRYTESIENLTLNRIAEPLLAVFDDPEKSNLSELIKNINQSRRYVAEDILNAAEIFNAFKDGDLNKASELIGQYRTQDVEHNNAHAKNWDQVKYIIQSELEKINPETQVVVEKAGTEGYSLFERLAGDQAEVHIKSLISSQTSEDVEKLKQILASDFLTKLGSAYSTRLTDMAQSWIASNLLKKMMERPEYTITPDDIGLLAAVRESDLSLGSTLNIQKGGIVVWNVSTDSIFTQITDHLTGRIKLNANQLDNFIQAIVTLARFNDNAIEKNYLETRFNEIKLNPNEPDVNSVQFKFDQALFSAALAHKPEFGKALTDFIFNNKWNPTFAHLVESTSTLTLEQRDNYRLKRVMELFDSDYNANSTKAKIQQVESIAETHNPAMKKAQTAVDELELEDLLIVSTEQGRTALNELLVKCAEASWSAAREQIIQSLQKNPAIRLSQLQQLRNRWLVDILTGKETNNEPALRTKLAEISTLPPNEMAHAYLEFVGADNLANLPAAIQKISAKLLASDIKPFTPNDFMNKDINDVESVDDETRSLIQRVGITGETLVQTLKTVAQELKSHSIEIDTKPLEEKSLEIVRVKKAAIDMNSMTKGFYATLREDIQKAAEGLIDLDTDILKSPEQRKHHFVDSLEYDFSENPKLFIMNFKIPCVELCKAYAEELVKNGDYEKLAELKDSSIITSLAMDQDIKLPEEYSYLKAEHAGKSKNLKFYVDTEVVSHKLSALIETIIEGFKASSQVYSRKTNDIVSAYTEINRLLSSTHEFRFILPKEKKEQFIAGIGFEYDLVLMSTLPDNDKNKAEVGKIYLSDAGKYIVRDFKGIIHEGQIDTKVVNLDNLGQKLNQSDFKSAILQQTSKAGHTPSISGLRQDKNLYQKQLATLLLNHIADAVSVAEADPAKFYTDNTAYLVRSQFENSQLNVQCYKNLALLDEGVERIFNGEFNVQFNADEKYLHDALYALDQDAAYWKKRINQLINAYSLSQAAIHGIHNPKIILDEGGIPSGQDAQKSAYHNQEYIKKMVDSIGTVEQAKVFNNLVSSENIFLLVQELQAIQNEFTTSPISPDSLAKFREKVISVLEEKVFQNKSFERNMEYAGEIAKEKFKDILVAMWISSLERIDNTITSSTDKDELIFIQTLSSAMKAHKTSKDWLEHHCNTVLLEKIENKPSQLLEEINLVKFAHKLGATDTEEPVTSDQLSILIKLNTLALNTFNLRQELELNIINFNFHRKIEELNFDIPEELKPNLSLVFSGDKVTVANRITTILLNDEIKEWITSPDSRKSAKDFRDKNLDTLCQALIDCDDAHRRDLMIPKYTRGTSYGTLIHLENMLISNIFKNKEFTIAFDKNTPSPSADVLKQIQLITRYGSPRQRLELYGLTLNFLSDNTVNIKQKENLLDVIVNKIDTDKQRIKKDLNSLRTILADEFLQLCSSQQFKKEYLMEGASDSNINALCYAIMYCDAKTRENLMTPPFMARQVYSASDTIRDVVVSYIFKDKEFLDAFDKQLHPRPSILSIFPSAPKLPADLPQKMQLILNHASSEQFMEFYAKAIGFLSADNIHPAYKECLFEAITGKKEADKQKEMLAQRFMRHYSSMSTQDQEKYKQHYIQAEMLTTQGVTVSEKGPTKTSPNDLKS